MLVKLVCLHKRGVALSAAELAEEPRYTGNLIVGTDWMERHGTKKALRMARLREVVPFTSSGAYRVPANLGSRSACTQSWQTNRWGPIRLGRTSEIFPEGAYE